MVNAVLKPSLGNIAMFLDLCFLMYFLLSKQIVIACDMLIIDEIKCISNV